ncbi:MAG: hypothetical protein RJA70_3544 [Pseudomonadota bacterium]
MSGNPRAGRQLLAASAVLVSEYLSIATSDCVVRHQHGTVFTLPLDGQSTSTWRLQDASNGWLSKVTLTAPRGVTLRVWDPRADGGGAQQSVPADAGVAVSEGSAARDLAGHGSVWCGFPCPRDVAERARCLESCEALVLVTNNTSNEPISASIGVQANYEMTCGSISVDLGLEPAP